MKVTLKGGEGEIKKKNPGRRRTHPTHTNGKCPEQLHLIQTTEILAATSKVFGNINLSGAEGEGGGENRKIP